MNVELANYLLALDKQLVENGQSFCEKDFNIVFPINLRLSLIAVDDPDQSFLVDIKESEKKSLKISLHHQDDSTQNGILRIDYLSRHKNPEEIIDTVPAHFRNYAGAYLDESIGHIHYIVDGYKPLAWAIPLDVDDFTVKNVESKSKAIEAVKEFFNRINVTTEIRLNYQESLL